MGLSTNALSEAFVPGSLTKTEEFDLWLEGETIEALKLQRPLSDEMLSIVAWGEKEDPPLEAVAVRTMGTARA